MDVSLRLRPNGSYTAKADPGEPSTGQPRWSVTEREGKFLRHVAWRRNVLEIGTGLSISTSWLDGGTGTTFPGEWPRHLTTCDIDPWVHTNIWDKLPPHIDKFVDYHDTLEWGPYDVTFIDGDHRAEQVAEDVRYALLCTRGLIVLHDGRDVGVREGATGVLGSWSLMDTTHGILTAWAGF